jgi:hypothetical protein
VRIDLDFVAVIAEQVEGFSNVTGGKDAECLAHDLEGLK